MADSSKVNQRTTLNRIILDTPALLNLVKHCRESDINANGLLMGVIQENIG